jgi:hypothetical protein
MIKPDHKLFRLVWINSTRQVLTTYRLAKTPAEAVTSFYKAQPRGHLAHICEKSH